MAAKKRKLSPNTDLSNSPAYKSSSRSLLKDIRKYTGLDIILELRNPRFSSLSVELVVDYGDRIGWQTKQNKRIPLNELLEAVLNEQKQTQKTKAKRWKQSLVKSINQLCDSKGRVSRDVAERLILKSYFWETHHSGPVQQRGMLKYIIGARENWRLDYGQANVFLISKAVERCCRYIEEWIKSVHLPVTSTDWDLFIRRLKRIICGCVEGYGGDEYSIYGSSLDNMSFGSHALHVNVFLRELILLLNFYDSSVLKKSDFNRLTKQVAAPKAAQLITSISTVDKNPMVVCPQCGVNVSQKRLHTHLKKRCPGAIKKRKAS
ncbi:MAG: hypothetical protein ACERJ1_08025 [Halodesulfovibrio sp.]|uniref:hypothetical protein n=1 Tax=Halodesulfovibrio sp. TaxID=1912772 RepID=UPI00359D64E3